MKFKAEYLITQYTPKKRTIISVEQSLSPFSRLTYEKEYPYAEKEKKKFLYRKLNESQENPSDGEEFILELQLPYEYKTVEEGEEVTDEWEFVEVESSKKSWDDNIQDIASKLSNLRIQHDDLLKLHMDEIEGEADITELWLKIKELKNERADLLEKAKELPTFYFGNMEQVHQFIRQNVLPLLPAQAMDYELSLIPSFGAEQRLYYEPSDFLKKNESGVLIEYRSRYERYALLLTFTSTKEDR